MIVEAETRANELRPSEASRDAALRPHVDSRENAAPRSDGTLSPRRDRPRPRAAEPALAFGATCPECGGSLRIGEGDRSVRCGYCGSALYVAVPRGVQSYIVRPKISAGKARLAAIRYIEENTRGRIHARHTSIRDLELIHVPFWHLRGRLMGWVSGDRIKLVRVEQASEEGNAREIRTTVREERESFARLVFKRADWSAPACVLPCLGVQGVSLRASLLEWDPLDDKKRREYTVALPTRSAWSARKDAYRYLTGLVVPPGTIVNASRFHLFDSILSLYYYPFHLIRYRYRGRIFTITVDAGTGSVVRGEVPSRRAIEAKRLFFGPAALAFIAATWLPLVLVPIVSLYLLDTIQARRFVPPHEWFALRIDALLESEE
jgi:hypothetical protein